MVLTNYLVEETLGDILQYFCKETESTYIKAQVKFPELGALSFDYMLEIDNNKILVEFDGYYHYSDSMTIFRDLKKSQFAVDNNYTLIRIPYWIQLNKSTFKTLFYRELDIDSTYPQGFIDKKAMLPASFCKLGFERFEKELFSFENNIQDQIIASLENKAKTLKVPLKFVYK
jgi:hypothetical protein